MKFVSNVKPGSDQGSVLTLGIGLIVACLMFVTVVSDVSTMWIARAAMHRIADGAALSAVQSVNSDAIYRKGLGTGLALNSTLASNHARHYVATHGVANTVTDVRLTSVSVVGDTVTVTIVATPKLPFGYLLPIHIGPMQAMARARYVLR